MTWSDGVMIMMMMVMTLGHPTESLNHTYDWDDDDGNHGGDYSDDDVE